MTRVAVGGTGTAKTVIEPKPIVSRRRLRTTVFALAASALVSSLVQAVCMAVASSARGEGWDWAFLIPIAIAGMGILLPLVAGIRIINGGSLGWLTLALCYLGLRVLGDLSLPFAAVLLRWPINIPVVLLYLFEFQFVCVWVYAVRVTMVAHRTGCTVRD